MRNFLFAITIMMAYPTMSSAAQISCSDEQKKIPVGFHLGRFTDVMYMEGWGQVNFFFLKKDDSKYYCVQVNRNNAPDEFYLSMKAFLIGSEVMIRTGNNYYLQGVGYRSDR